MLHISYQLLFSFGSQKVNTQFQFGGTFFCMLTAWICCSGRSYMM